MMQSKVSMVVPCYNKVNDIGTMLESVMAQVWDNIELILVNDGSTDGTREVISEYESRLQARGYQVVIVDQMNAGCCAAVYAGLLKVTGDYFCLVDCDDCLEPEYVSVMAGWLDEHEDYDWAACSYRPYFVREGKVEPGQITSAAAMSDNKQLLERHILRKIITTSWVYMSRVSYLKRCRLVENFCVERRKTYEPLFAVPLMLGGGKLKSFDAPLYRFNRFASDMYSFDSYEKVDKYYTDYSYLYKWSIERADISQDEKNRLLALVRLGKVKDCLYHLNDMDLGVQAVSDRDQYIDGIADSTTSLIDELFDPKPHLAPDIFKSKAYMKLMDVLDQLILEPDKFSFIESTSNSRIIAYGALGKVASAILPLLTGTKIEPNLYWDMSADSSSTHRGNVVTQPKFNELQREDIIIIFPGAPEILQYVQERSQGVQIIDSTLVKAFIRRNTFSEIASDCVLIYSENTERKF
ncbi:glycosyltransferase family 2 protein [Paenibacillus polysaccharolyticus]|uniref:glycosyltransferase family 2 protein n=1 Tax=Paenibacillus polysaccharolyticus TaxID=582692 RepID=UPI002040650A|nr:glycosyltransferase family 2 protein [Paenibacillus polysaccharolyticus]MCM3135737.1 glycosyltransferase family 2 protein [Paenibacillus polysaccharolyticus]